MTTREDATADALDVLIVEDEVLLAEELGFLVREAGLREGRAPGRPPLGLSLSPRFRDLWDAGLAATG